MSTQSFSSAVVLGAGIAGMLAAQALSKRFKTVTVLDRRALDDELRFDKDVPQSDHLHVMLKRGQLIIDRAFPGLMRECAKSPEMSNDWGTETYWVNPFGAYPKHETPIQTWHFSRKTLDRQMLKRLNAIPNITVKSAKVQKLVGTFGKVSGVVIEPNEAGEQTLLNADLVVDCRGRNSPLISDLEALGYPKPPITKVDNELGYASQFFQLPKGESAKWKLTYLQVREGLRSRGGALCEYADGNVIAILIGYGDDRPPANQEEFLAFMASVPDSEIFKDLKGATPLGKPRTWRNLGNCRRHFGRMKQWPKGLIALGDAVCHFNPVYGQGMTVAAVESEALSEALDKMQNKGWEAAFQRRLEQLVMVPWTMSVTEDQRSKNANPSLPTRVLHQYLDQVLRGAVRDPILHSAFLRVLHMVSSPASLFTPQILARVAARSIGRGFNSPPNTPANVATGAELARLGAMLIGAPAK